MATVPSVAIPIWAFNDLNDPQSGAPNKLDPTTELENSGLKRDEPITRQHLNHILYAMGEHIRYLQEQINELP